MTHTERGLDDAVVFSTVYRDGSAEFTLSVDGEAHRFSATSTQDGTGAIVSYDETLSHRGELRVREPDEPLWRRVMQSDEMSDYADSHGLEQIIRDRQ